jgi:cytochrome c-type protein NapC
MRVNKYFSIKNIAIAGAIFLAGILFLGGTNAFFAYTNQLEFCTSCHTMQVNLEELKETVHYKNASGVQATCADCHVPKAFFPKLKAKIFAAKDVYHEIMGTIDTQEKYEARRWQMASVVWAKMKASDSRECRSCHDFKNMDLSAQDRMARKKHGRATDKGQTCIDCHKGIAHLEPDIPDDVDVEDEEDEEDSDEESNDSEADATNDEEK